MELLLFFFALAVVLSFLCSLWEAVLLSVTPTYAQASLDRGSTLGRQLKKFKDNIDRPLAAILTLNTIAHTVGAIGVGSQANRIWADAHPVLTSFVVPAVMTLAVLLFSEIVPKTIGANSWRRLAPFTVRSIKLLIVLLWPLVWMSQGLTRALKQDKSAPVLTRSDLMTMARLGGESGALAEDESELISNTLKLRSIHVRDVMTPRTVVIAASDQESVADFLEQHPNLPFSRIPIYSDGNKDRIHSFVLKTDLLNHRLDAGGDAPLKELERDIVVVPASAYLPQLFRLFTDTGEHLALVVDEYGDMEGVVTMEDVIETLLGREIVDETDDAEDMQAVARDLGQKRRDRFGVSDDSSSDP